MPTYTYTQTIPMHADFSLRLRTQIPSQDVPPTSSPNQHGAPTDGPIRCPVCGKTFSRTQERDRHVRKYLPYWFFCPFAGCSWRGDRYKNLKAHWNRTHTKSCVSPQLEDCKIYHPGPLVRSVVSGQSSIEEVTAIALFAVESRATELDKIRVWTDWWGRRQRVVH